MMATISRLNVLTAERYLPFVPGPHRPVLCDPDEATGTIALGASQDGEPAGLALARHHGDDAEILSLFVVPRCRRHGIGTALLDSLEQILSDRGVRAAQLIHATGVPGTQAIERTLRGCGWPLHGPSLFLFVVELDVMSNRWATGVAIPPDCEISPWLSLTLDERSALRADRGAWIPDRLMPLRFEDHNEPSTSLILRKGGRVAGWLLTHVVDRATLDYTNLFVRPEVNRSGSSYLSLALLAEGFRRHEALQGRHAQGRFVIHEENVRFVRFVDRRMQAFIRRRTVMRRLSKPLGRQSPG